MENGPVPGPFFLQTRRASKHFGTFSATSFLACVVAMEFKAKAAKGGGLSGETGCGTVYETLSLASRNGVSAMRGQPETARRVIKPLQNSTRVVGVVPDICRVRY